MGVYTYDEALQIQGLGAMHLRVFLAAGFGYAAIGAETMIMTVLSTWIQCQFNATALQAAIMDSLLFGGKMAGNTLKGTMSDYFGRKRTISLYLWICTFSGLLFGLAPTLSWIFMFRFMVGFATGVVFTDYAIEFFPPLSRKLIVLIREFWAGGTVLALYVASRTKGISDWRNAVLLLGIMPFISAVFLSTVPESPRYLLVHGKKQEASRILKRMAKGKLNHVPLEYIETTQAQKETNSNSSAYVIMFNKEYRLVTGILFLCRFAQGFLYYGVIILSVTHFREEHRFKNTISKVKCSECEPLVDYYYHTQMIYAVGDMCGSLLIYCLIDKIGRIRAFMCMFCSYSVCLLCLMLVRNASIAVVVIFIARMTINGGGSAVAQYNLEIYPTTMRGTSFSALLNAQFLGGMIAPFITEVLINVNSSLPNLLLFITGVVTTVACIFLPGDTNGKDLKDYH